MRQWPDTLYRLQCLFKILLDNFFRSFILGDLMAGTSACNNDRQRNFTREALIFFFSSRASTVLSHRVCQRARSRRPAVTLEFLRVSILTRTDTSPFLRPNASSVVPPLIVRFTRDRLNGGGRFITSGSSLAESFSPQLLLFLAAQFLQPAASAREIHSCTFPLKKFPY